jgi:hypothetical protein
MVAEDRYSQNNQQETDTFSWTYPNSRTPNSIMMRLTRKTQLTIANAFAKRKAGTDHVKFVAEKRDNPTRKKRRTRRAKRDPL